MPTQRPPSAHGQRESASETRLLPPPPRLCFLENCFLTSHRERLPLPKNYFSEALQAIPRSCSSKPVQITAHYRVTRHPFQLSPAQYSAMLSTEIPPDAEVAAALRSHRTAAVKHRVATATATSEARGPAPPSSCSLTDAFHHCNSLTGYRTPFHGGNSVTDHRTPTKIAGSSGFKFPAGRGRYAARNGPRSRHKSPIYPGIT